MLLGIFCYGNCEFKIKKVNFIRRDTMPKLTCIIFKNIIYMHKNRTPTNYYSISWSFKYYPLKILTFCNIKTA